MYKVMLIEDEPPILHMVKDMIEASGQSFVVSYTAFNGRKALQLLEENDVKPDLIMTDIRMPVMDGLQFMKTLISRGYDIPCIVLSGYSDFNYAREALQSHAYDYLLKPLKMAHLEKCLIRTADLLHKRKEMGERVYLKQALRLSDADDLDTDLVKPACEGYQILLWRKGTHRNEEWEELVLGFGGWKEKEENTISQFLSECVKNTPIWWLNGITSNEKIAIIGLQDKESTAICRDVADMMLQKWDRCQGGVDAPLCLAVSASVTTDQMASSLRLLRKSLLSVSKIGESCLWFDGDHDKRDFVLTAEMEQDCRLLANSRDYHSFEKTMVGWKERWKKEGYSQLIIESLLMMVVRFFRIQRPLENESAVPVFEANALVSGCKTLDEVSEQFCGFMKEEFSRLNDIRSHRSAKDLIEQVKLYLDEHYMEPIGSEQLQQVFGYNKTYISNVFSDVVGIPPGKYLSKIRIEKAMELLHERPELSLRQVAEQVGYEDSLYFSKVFKNATGLSPKAYKERRGQHETI